MGQALPKTFPAVIPKAVVSLLGQALGQAFEQDHRLIKRITKPMLGFKCFFSAQKTLAGIELVRMLRKGQMRYQAGMSKTPAELFYALAE